MEAKALRESKEALEAELERKRKGDMVPCADSAELAAIPAAWRLHVKQARECRSRIVEAHRSASRGGWQASLSDDDVSVVRKRFGGKCKGTCFHARCSINAPLPTVLGAIESSPPIDLGAGVLQSDLLDAYASDEFCLRLIHVVCRLPLAFASSRDFCVLEAIHRSADESTTIITHSSVLDEARCPLHPEFVRGEVGLAGWLVEATAARIISSNTPFFLRNAETSIVNSFFLVDIKLGTTWLADILLEETPLHRMAALRSSVMTAESKAHACCLIYRFWKARRRTHATSGSATLR
jgi:hypothetical protein